MHAAKTIALALALACAHTSLDARAQSCSGGAGGGMDATGNLCNAPSEAVVGATAESVRARPVEARALPLASVARATASKSERARPSIAAWLHLRPATHREPSGNEFVR